MNFIAIDDEPLALNVIKEFSAKIPFMKLINTCNSALHALQILHENEVDLIFLDIQMPHLTGLDFIKTIPNPPMIIFTTAYSEFAVNGFEVNAIDYLIKPFSFERFVKAVEKAYNQYNLKKTTVSLIPNELPERKAGFLMVKVEYSIMRIELDKILYIEGLKDYVKIYTGLKPILTKTTMKNLEEKLPGGTFLRVHKSFIVSTGKIDLIENNRIRIGEKYIPIGNQYRSDFFNFIDKNKL